MGLPGTRFTRLVAIAITFLHFTFGHSFSLRPLQYSRHHCLLFERNTRSLVENTRNNPKNSNSKRASKLEINSLVKNIGLKPVHDIVEERGDRDDGNASKLKQKRSNKSPTNNLSLKTQLQYARKGHAVMRNTIPPKTLQNIRKDLLNYCAEKDLESWQQKVEVALELSSSKVSKSYTTIIACQRALKKQAPDGIVEIPFLQHFNTWRTIPSVQALVTSDPLTTYAQTLLDVSSVRLYQDSLFHKRGNDGPTPWHSDARMAPFDTSKMITFWIPLDYIPPLEDGGTGLFFVSGSHSDFALPFWNRNDGNDSGGEYDRLDERYGGDNYVVDHMPLSIGDVTAHAGWTLHGAAGGIGGGDRYALAVTYVDAMAQIREDAANSSRGHDEDKRSYQDWIKDVEPRSYFEHDLVPIVIPEE